MDTKENKESKELQWLDQWMDQLPSEEVSHDFTMQIVADAYSRKRKRSNRRIMIGVLSVLLIGLSLCLYYLPGLVSVEGLSFSENMSEQLIQWSEGWALGISFEVLLVIEGLLVLLLMERLLRRMRFFRHFDSAKK